MEMTKDKIENGKTTEIVSEKNTDVNTGEGQKKKKKKKVVSPEMKEVLYYLNKNVEFIERKFSLNQGGVGNAINVTSSKMSKVLSGDQELKYEFLLSLKKKYGYSVDELTHSDIEAKENENSGKRADEQEEREKKNTENLPMPGDMKFTDLFQCYYFDTSPYKGREYADDKKALKSGLMNIDIHNEEMRVRAYLNLQKDEADAFYADASACKEESEEKFEECWKEKSSRSHYVGTIRFSKDVFYIELSAENQKDTVLLIFHLPNSSSSTKYIGGLGVAASCSRGKSPSPTIQYLAICDEALTVSEEEIADNLLMHFPNVKSHEMIDTLTEQLIQLFDKDDSGKNRLTHSERTLLIRHHIDHVVTTLIERNLFRKQMVSQIDDDSYYHFLKRTKRVWKQKGKR